MNELRTAHFCTYRALLDPVQLDVGLTYFGRRIIAIVTGGDFSGARLRGKVLSGGGDWATVEEGRDVLRLDVRAAWQTDDGANIYVSYRGVLRPLSEARAQASRGGTATNADRENLYFRINPLFETGDARYQWLNDMVCVGVGSLISGGVKYELHEVL